MTILKEIKLEPQRRKIQIHKRADGQERYIVTLPKSIMDKVRTEHKEKKGVYAIHCLTLLVEDGNLFIEIDETKVMY